jgi:hypothetical protein
MARITVRLLVTQDLKYCCLWFFLTRFRRTRLVADRLGLTDQAIRACRSRVRSGEEKCEGRENCMHQKVTMQLRPRQPKGEKLD